MQIAPLVPFGSSIAKAITFRSGDQTGSNSLDLLLVSLVRLVPSDFILQMLNDPSSDCWETIRRLSNAFSPAWLRSVTQTAIMQTAVTGRSIILAIVKGQDSFTF